MLISGEESVSVYHILGGIPCIPLCQRRHFLNNVNYVGPTQHRKLNNYAALFLTMETKHIMLFKYESNLSPLK